MKHKTRIAAALLSVLCLSSATAAAQPASSEEVVNIFSDVIDQTNQMDIAVFTVPAGRQLIIDHVSLRVRVPGGETVSSAAMNLPNVHFFVLAAQGTDIQGRSVFAASQTTRLVVGPGQTIAFRMERDNYGTPASVAVSIAGRLVKAP